VLRMDGDDAPGRVPAPQPFRFGGAHRTRRHAMMQSTARLALYSSGGSSPAAVRHPTFRARRPSRDSLVSGRVERGRAVLGARRRGAAV
jgi:hypothetical protein